MLVKIKSYHTLNKSINNILLMVKLKMGRYWSLWLRLWEASWVTIISRMRIIRYNEYEKTFKKLERAIVRVVIFWWFWASLRLVVSRQTEKFY